MRLAALTAAALALAPALPAAQEPAGPDVVALADELIAAIDSMLVDLDRIVVELDLAAAEAPDDEQLLKLLAAYTAERDALRARRAELEALKADAEVGAE